MGSLRPEPPIPVITETADSTNEGTAVLFRVVVNEHAPRVARTLRYLGVPSADVDDALQEVFLTAHKRWAQLLEHGDLGAWLRSVALNVARNRRRSRRRSPVHFVADVPERAAPGGPDEVAVARERFEHLLRLLDRLDPESRTALVLFEVDGVPVTELAVLLEVSVPTAYRRITAARAAIRQALDQERAQT